MTRLPAALLALATLAVAAPASAHCLDQDNFAIIVHGGTSSGKVYPERLAFIENMLAKRRAELMTGDRAIDIVERAIVEMEDSGLFNAGRAAITNSAGYVELDASIMDGRTLDAGAVASQLTLKNPIRAARLVMDETRHVMMVGDRGEAAVISLGAETVEPGEYFLRAKPREHPKEHGTVGAAVLDRCGDLAAGTSTGGYDSKIPGRVGDSPIIGAGSYAKNGVMAASSTGHGEYFIRHTALRTIAARMEYGGAALDTAARKTLREMRAAGREASDGGTDGRGGVIAVDAEGNFSFAHSYAGMIHGMTDHRTEPRASQLGSKVE